MGANATTFVPKYTSGEVLTAANLSVTNSGIPVFADSAARTAAFGGTGEKVLAEGQYAYLESDNSTSFYDGSSWIAVGATPGTKPITPSSVAVGSGSATINAGGSVTFTGASSVSLNGVFSSTYTNYAILLNCSATSSEQDVNMRFRAAGSDTSTSTYKRYKIGLTSGISGVQATTTSFTVASPNSTYVYGSGNHVIVYGPNVAQRTAFQALWQQADSNNDQSVQISSGNQSDSTQFDGFTLFVGGTFAGTVTVYGYSI